MSKRASEYDLTLQASRKRGITEVDVGITEYMNPDAAGFRGLLKQRYTDFQVHEIASDGSTVHLTDLGGWSPKKEAIEEKPGKSEKTLSTAESKPKIVISAEQRADLESLLGAEFIREVEEFLSRSDKKRLQTTASFPDKQERTRVHQLVREAFKGMLATNINEEQQFIVEKSTPARSKKRRSTKKADGSGAYLQFTLYKENRDTMEAISTLSRLLRVPQRALGFAGTKDRRAATTQRVSLHHGEASRIAALNGALPPSIRLGNFSYSLDGLRLGDLVGNEFWIALRDVGGDATEGLSGLRDKGFVNYFGLQRFGTFSVSSHTLGLLMLCGKYDEAVDALLQPQEVTADDSRAAREEWARSRDPEKTLELMPRRAVAEVAVLTALKESPSSLNALLRIPRTLKMMYIHAYQSYVWNSMASLRVKLGTTVMEGDLVLVDGEPEKVTDVTKHTIYDVVLPTPGWDVTYPAQLKEDYISMMRSDGIDPMGLRNHIKELSLAGTYRYVFAKPHYLEWWTVEYTDPEEALVRTDLEILQASSPLENVSTAHTATESSNIADEGESKNPPPVESSQRLVQANGPLQAIVIRLSLASSQYATMALREAMKAETARHGDIYFAKDAYNDDIGKSPNA